MVSDTVGCVSGTPSRCRSGRAPSRAPLSSSTVQQIMRLRLPILIASLITVALWLCVLSSAGSFYAWASDYVAQTGSANAANDLRYSQILLVAAGVGLTAGLACAAWLACKQSTGAIVAETWAACFGVAFFAGDHAHPIHLFPTGGPLLEAFAATGAVLATALVATHLAVRGRLPNTHKAPRSQ